MARKKRKPTVLEILHKALSSAVMEHGYRGEDVMREMIHLACMMGAGKSAHRERVHALVVTLERLIERPHLPPHPNEMRLPEEPASQDFPFSSSGLAHTR